jgi:L-ascorbate metabolism protein UlaG (beta-lactamase superfamily)
MTPRITYFGHATILIEVGGARLLTDPILRRAVFGGIITRAEAPPEIEVPDAVLLSHQHADHLDLPSLRMLGNATEVIAPRGAGKRLRRGGMTTVREVEAGETESVRDVEVVATPAVHDGRRFPFGRPVEALGYEIRGGGARVYFAGDTDLFPGMAALTGVDIALLPIGGWGGNEMGKGHLDPERAAEAAALIGARVAIPIHWGTLLRADLHRRSRDLHGPPAEEFRARMAELAPETEIRVLDPGESYEFQD